MSADPISMGLMAASSLLGGFEERRAQRAYARQEDANGYGALLEGEQLAQQTRHEERLMAGELIASQGESGLAVGTGTALDLIQQSALQREIEIGNIRAQASGEAQNHFQAARDARRAGNAALVKGVFGAAGAAVDYASSRSANRRVSAARDSVRKAAMGGRYGGSKGSGYAPSRPYSGGGGDVFARGPFGRLRAIGLPSD